VNVCGTCVALWMTMATPERRPRIATAWLGGCSGCHMSFLDLDERLLDLAAIADVVFTPIADFKEFPENVDVTLVEGAVANEDHVEMLQRIRERSQIVASLGDCAVTGNVTALRNVWPVDVVLRNTFGDTPPHEPGIVPPLTSRVAPLHHLVRIDAFIPGCPPDADRIWAALLALVGDAPVGAPDGAAARFG
jgi:NAD-reducing hydrogenase small subunit